MENTPKNSDYKYPVGSMRYGSEVLPLDQRKKILFLCDDIRMASGIATMGKEITLGIVHRYSVIQIAGAINHPDKGKIIDLSADTRTETGVEDAHVVLYPTDGYGNPDLVRELIARENPDAIFHFTDPRFWGWLYQMEAEIRREIPITYLNIWDDLPVPEWNSPFYESCDLLMAISKQTYHINKTLLPKYEDWQIRYVPHGVSEKYYYPIREGHEQWESLQTFKTSIAEDAEFIIALNNRNIRRKNIADIILAYNDFCKKIPEDKAKKCALILHTQPIDQNGTDLPRVVQALCPDYKVIFSNQPANTTDLNYLYNVSDVVINIASNEGFGLTTCEALMAGTPIIVNVTGGLQDQCGFKKNGKHLTADDYIDIGTLHRKGDIDESISWGEWVEPVWPASRSVKGSVPTPYIFDDTVDYEDVIDALMYWYTKSKDDRNEAGLAGREFVLSGEAQLSSSEMAKNVIDCYEKLFKFWKPVKRFELVDTYPNLKRPNIKYYNINQQAPVPGAPKKTKLQLPKLKKIKK